MSVSAIESYEDYLDLISSGDVVIIEFWTTEGGPHETISSVFEDLASKSEFSEIKFAKVDVDAQPEILNEAGIGSFPTFVAFVNGNKLDEFVGTSPQGLEALVEQFSQV
ncbi:hypothetical protein ABZX51_005220 [Aspergillus tubingensis]|uniref:Thioredoxin domain-containing protein n=1 Tax=Aspergillus tubingensis (strain CBS 134.48) TaxID=767770 RepID=A0A1L9NLV9_ASPTC|nr:hypothetical protein ASPTUDRAFT_62344 [Aspergillus tubingensis CBS 134.48]